MFSLKKKNTKIAWHKDLFNVSHNSSNRTDVRAGPTASSAEEVLGKGWKEVRAGQSVQFPLGKAENVVCCRDAEKRPGQEQRGFEFPTLIPTSFAWEGEKVAQPVISPVAVSTWLIRPGGIFPVIDYLHLGFESVGLRSKAELWFLFKRCLAGLRIPISISRCCAKKEPELL